MVAMCTFSVRTTVRVPRLNTPGVDTDGTDPHYVFRLVSPRGSLPKESNRMMKYLIQTNFDIPFLSRAVIVLMLTLAVGAIPAQAQDCPAENRFARSLVMSFLVDSQFADNRQETGSTSIDTSNVQRVQDLSTCETLDSRYGKLDVELRDVVYYRAADQYFVAVPFQEGEDGTRALGIEFLIVLDNSLSEIKKYGL